MREHSFERSGFFNGHRRGERRLKPAAVLIRAFKIKIRGKTQPLPFSQYGLVTNTGIKPNINDVLVLLKILRTAFAFKTRGQKFSGRPRKPGIRAFLLKNLMNLRAVSWEIGLAPIAMNHRNRNSPIPLAGKAPVGSPLNHRSNAVLSPVGSEFNFRLNGRRHFFAHIIMIDFHEPLGRRAENNRLLAAPAMRIRVSVFFSMKKRAFFPEDINDFLIPRFQNMQAFAFRKIFGKFSPMIDGRENGKMVFKRAVNIIVFAVARGDMNNAGSVFSRHIISVDHLRHSIKKWMFRFKTGKIPALFNSNFFNFLQSKLRSQRVFQSTGKYQPALFSFDRDIFQIRVKRESHVRG